MRPPGAGRKKAEVIASIQVPGGRNQCRVGNEERVNRSVANTGFGRVGRSASQRGSIEEPLEGAMHGTALGVQGLECDGVGNVRVRKKLRARVKEKIRVKGRVAGELNCPHIRDAVENREERVRNSRDATPSRRDPCDDVPAHGGNARERKGPQGIGRRGELEDRHRSPLRGGDAVQQDHCPHHRGTRVWDDGHRSRGGCALLSAGISGNGEGGELGDP